MPDITAHSTHEEDLRSARIRYQDANQALQNAETEQAERNLHGQDASGGRVDDTLRGRDGVAQNELYGYEGNNHFIGGHNASNFMWAGHGNNEFIGGNQLNFIKAGNGDNRVTLGDIAGLHNTRIALGHGANHIELGKASKVW